MGGQPIEIENQISGHVEGGDMGMEPATSRGGGGQFSISPATAEMQK